MKLPPEAKPALLGACAGAIALAVTGFGWGGWMTPGEAARMAETHSTRAVVKVLAPICVHKFQQESNAAAKLTDLKATNKYLRSDYIAHGGWATMVGADHPAPGTAEACAEMLSNLPG